MNNEADQSVEEAEEDEDEEDEDETWSMADLDLRTMRSDPQLTVAGRSSKFECSGINDGLLLENILLNLSSLIVSPISPVWGTRRGS